MGPGLYERQCITFHTEAHKILNRLNMSFLNQVIQLNNPFFKQVSIKYSFSIYAYIPIIKNNWIHITIQTLQPNTKAIIIIITIPSIVPLAAVVIADCELETLVVQTLLS